MRDLKILLLENEQPWQKIIQQDIQQVLSAIGHPNDPIEVVETLDQARQALENEKQWNLLVADVFPPSSSEMKGIELLRQADQLGIATIILSDRETLTNLQQDELSKHEKIQGIFSKENYYNKINDFVLKVQQILTKVSRPSLTKKELFGSELKKEFNQIWNNSISAIEQNRLDKFRYEADILTKLLCKNLDFILLDDTADLEHWYGSMIDASNPAFQLNIQDKFPVIYICKIDCGEEDILKAIALLNKFRIIAKYFAIIIVFCNKESIIKQVRQSVYKNDFIVLDRYQIWNILAAESPLKQLTEYILEQIDLIDVSPYTYAGPVKYQMFFGREQEKKTLIENISRNDYAILANRKTGKTSLLNRIFPILDQNPSYQVFYCDLQAVRDYDSFYKNLATLYPEFKAEIAKLDQPTALDFYEIINYIKQHNNNRQIIIIFDEVDELLSYDLQSREQLFGTFRSLSQRENVHFIFSGTTTLVKRVLHPDSPLFNFCQTIKIDLLDEKSATDLIIVPMENIGVKFEDIKSENGKEIKFENKKAIVESILSIAARHPNLIQYLCDSLIKRINNKQERTITERDIKNVINSDEFYEYGEALIWGQAKAIDKLIVYLMWSYPQFTESDVIKEFKKRGLETDGVKDSLETLQIYTTLRQKNRTYSFTYRDFAILMRQRSDIEALVEIYQQEVGGSKL